MRRTFVLLAALVLSAAHAFTWEPFAFPEGDQGYTLEIAQEGDGPVTTIDIDVTSTGDGFDVTTTTTVRQTGIAQEEVEDAMFGGGFGLFAMGPMMMFGPSFMMVPMMLGEEEVRVRAEPMRMMGFGSVFMDREVEVAGRTCVVVRVVPDGNPDGEFEFALAEDLPFPCYSRYGQGDDVVEVRLVEVR